uniref:UBC core domain-containing protein n=1 Tax=Timema bartmani TaxID=61472 RepID=A0A7R9F6Y1_9NEOP|nr:unnamed protein product [Timema bartmani]
MHVAVKVDTDIDTSEPFRRQGSLRRVLSSLPAGETQLSVSAKMIDRPAVSGRSVQKAYSQYQQEYSLIAEYNILQKQEIPGVYVIPSAQSSLCQKRPTPYTLDQCSVKGVSWGHRPKHRASLCNKNTNKTGTSANLWFGVLFVRQGLYQGGVFRFNIHIPETFPDGGCPHVAFQSRVFHPLVNEDTGEMDLKSGFPEWHRNVNHLWQVVDFLRQVFHKIESRSAVNQKAGDLYENNKEAFREQVRLCVKTSQDRVYDAPAIDDPHYITFDPYNDPLHGPIREAVFKPKEKEEETASLGYSWVAPDSLQPFSKPNS